MITGQSFSLRRVIRRLKKDDDFYNLFGPSFYRLPDDEKIKLFNKFPLLSENNITIKDVSMASEDLDNLQADRVRAHLESIINYLVSSQRTDGCWGIVTAENLIDFDHVVYGDHGKKIYNIPDSDKIIEDNGKTIKIPNAWTNSIITLILNKWLLVLEDYYFAPKNTVDRIKNAIARSSVWLEEHKNKNNDLEGFGPFPPSVNSILVNTYDTSFVYISQLYNSKISKSLFNENRLEKVYKNLISSQLYNNDAGAWYSDNIRTNNKLDVGATSYAVSLLLKINENKYSIDRNFVDFGIEWLIQQQNIDGGWGDIKDECSYVDKTCLAVMAIQKYTEYAAMNSKFEDIINNGLKFIESRIEEYHCQNKEGHAIQLHCWPKENQSTVEAICFKNSALAVSTLLKCDVPIYRGSVRRCVSSLIRLYKENHSIPGTQPILNIEEAYFVCMLADYLRAWIQV